MCAQVRVLSESYPINTNMTGFRRFSNIFASLHHCALNESSLSIGRVYRPPDLINALLFCFKWEHEHLDLFPFALKLCVKVIFKFS